jgi:type IV secretion system protein VirB6
MSCHLLELHISNTETVNESRVSLMPHLTMSSKMVFPVAQRRYLVPVKMARSKAVLYSIGTMFSAAAVSSTVSMISKLLGAVAVSYAAQYLVMLVASTSPEGVSSMAMQQGGLGLLMTLFLVTVPSMAATFFQGTVGQFMAYNAFGQGQAMQPTRAGGGYAPAPAANPLLDNAAASTQAHRTTVG